MSAVQDRVPKGVSAGGQFAAKALPEMSGQGMLPGMNVPSIYYPDAQSDAAGHFDYFSSAAIPDHIVHSVMQKWQKARVALIKAEYVKRYGTADPSEAVPKRALGVTDAMYSAQVEEFNKEWRAHGQWTFEVFPELKPQYARRAIQMHLMHKFRSLLPESEQEKLEEFTAEVGAEQPLTPSEASWRMGISTIEENDPDVFAYRDAEEDSLRLQEQMSELQSSLRGIAVDVNKAKFYAGEAMAMGIIKSGYGVESVNKAINLQDWSGDQAGYIFQLREAARIKREQRKNK